MNFVRAVLALSFLNLFKTGNTETDFKPRCRAGICDDRPECPRTSCACIYPSHVDCAVYYQCINGKPTQYKCSPGLLMNPLTLTCDYDFNVNCSIGKTTTTLSTNKVTTSQSEVTATESPETTTTPLTSRSSLTSPSTQHVSTKITTKPSTETTRLKTTSSPGGSTETTTSSISEVSIPTPTPPFECPEYYGLFPDPMNCRRFYHCSHGIPYHKWCPSDLHFNPHLLVCDWPYHAGCESFPTLHPPTTSHPPITSHPPTTRHPPPPINGTCECDCCIIPVSNDCRSFILCIDRQPFLKECQNGLYFNPMSGTCDKPENVECKPETHCPAANGRFPFPDSCSYFIECHDGVQSIKKCPEGLNYDDVSQTCDWSGTCQGIPDPFPTPLTPLDNINCTCNYCFERDPQDCSSYVLCRYHHAYKGKCADGLLFNEETDTCDYDYNVKCPGSEIPFVYCQEENGYFPYPGECNQYIHCVQWTPFIKQCPGNLHFDPHRKHCDYPWNAGCTSELNPTPTPGPTPPTTDCHCDCCIEPDPEDCSGFVVCIDKVGIHRRCSSGLLYNPVTENCDYEQNVQCIRPTDHPVPECSEDEGLTPYPDDCNKYFQCVGGHLRIKSCPENLHFNPQRKVCDWPEKAGCSGGPTVEPPTLPPQRPCDVCESCYIPHKYDCAAYTYCNNGSATELKCSEGLFFNPDVEDCDIASNVNCPGLPTDDCPESSGLYPTDDCSAYILCSNSVPYRKRCPSGLYFNPSTRMCDWPENVDCGAKPTPPPTGLPLGNCSCDCCFVPDEDDCAKFYLCLDRMMTVGYCSDGLLFNRVTENCDFADNVGCDDTSPVCVMPDGLFPNPEDCSTFYKCSNGVAEEMKCPPGLHFSNDLKQCEIPCLAKCDDEIECTTTTTSTTVTTTISPFCKEPNGFNPNPIDCGSFYQCSNGHAYLMKCPNGLHFSEEDKVCERPCEAQCDLSIDCRPTTTTSTTTTPKPHPYCKKPNGLNPNPQDCETFYQCSNGDVYLMRCPNGLHFSAEHSICERPCDAHCDVTLDCRPTTTPTITTTISPYCKEPNGFYPNPDDCVTFYQCINGNAYLVTCLNDLHFSAKHNVCEPPCDAQCDLTIDCSPTTTPISTTTISPYCKEPNGFYPNPDDCVTFYECINGEAYLVTCVHGLHFNAKHNVCEPPCDAQCDLTIDCRPTTTPTTTTTISPYCKEPTGYYPNPDDCASFYQCSHGNAYLVRCPDGLHYSAKYKVCERPCDAQCDLTIDCRPTTTPSTTTTPKPISPYCIKLNGLNPNPEDCETFYHCSNGDAYPMRCPNGLHFSAEDSVCERPCDAQCDLTIDCRPTTTPTTTTTISPYCKEPNGFNPNPDDCASFYQCSNGNSYLLRCPDGLHYSAQHKVCVRPCAAQCDLTIDCRPTTTSSTTTTTTTTISPYCKKPNGLNPNPGDCEYFYQCSNGNDYLMRCPNGLHFSAEHSVCERPCDAHCDLTIDCRPTTTPTSTTTVSPYCKEPNGFYPNPDDCVSFYECINGDAYPVTCVNGLHFNAKHNACEQPCDAQCDLTIDCETTSTKTTTTTSTVSPDRYCKDPNGLNPNPDDCGSFYQCVNGHAYLTLCPNGLHYNVEYEACERPCDAKCDPTIDCAPLTTTTSTSTTTSTPTRPIFPYCKQPKQPNELYPNPENCGSFYQCFNGYAYLIKCPSGLHFSEEHQVCTSPCDAKCDPTIDCSPSTATSTSTTTNTPTRPISPYCKESDGYYPNPEDCGSFYQCSNGISYLIKCPSGLHFNAKFKVCERPCDAKCDPTIHCTPTTTTGIPDFPYCKHRDGVNPNPDDCGSFFHCSDGQARLLKCPDGLHFSEEDEYCERPCDAKCDPSVECPVPRENCTCEACHLPDPVDCSAYYFCKNGKITQHFCPYGLLFNKATRMCDNEENVECVPTGDPSMCLAPDGVFPYPGDCQKYVYCENHVAYVMSCSPGEEFDYVTRGCEDGDGNCGHPTVSPHCPTPTGLFPHESNCTLFYHCDHGIAYLKDCPSPLFFNPQLEVCDWPVNVDCGQGSTVTISLSSTPKVSDETPSSLTSESVTVTSTTNYHNSSTISSVQTMSTVSSTPFPQCDIVPGVTCPCACRVPTYDDCSTFYQCKEDGTACKKSCPLGLYFNKKKMVCDLPKNVECRDFYFSMLKQRIYGPF